MIPFPSNNETAIWRSNFLGHSHVETAIWRSNFLGHSHVGLQHLLDTNGASISTTAETTNKRQMQLTI